MIAISIMAALTVFFIVIVVFAIIDARITKKKYEEEAIVWETIWNAEQKKDL